MPGRHDENQFIQKACGQALLAAPDGVAADDAEVQLSVLHALLDNLRVGDLELELDAGVSRAERGDESRHHVQSRRGARADRSGAVTHSVELPDRSTSTVACYTRP